MDERFAHDRFLVDQLVRPLINLYRVTPLAAGETPAGGPIAFVRQFPEPIERRLEPRQKSYQMPTHRFGIVDCLRKGPEVTGLRRSIWSRSPSTIRRKASRFA